MILFRAYDSETDSFVYSDKYYDDYFFEFNNGTLKAFKIVSTYGNIHEPPGLNAVELESVEQCLGVPDINDDWVFDNDIVEVVDEQYVGEDKHIYGVISYDRSHAVWEICFPNCSEAFGVFIEDGVKVIGNMHQNEDLWDVYFKEV